MSNGMCIWILNNKLPLNSVLHKVATEGCKTNLYPNTQQFYNAIYVFLKYHVIYTFYSMSRGCYLHLLRHQGARIPICIIY